MVVLRSTTPCVAVSSRSNSTLLTVISMVPTATAASTGIDFVSPAACYFYYYPYIKYKTYKTSSNSRLGGEVENFANWPTIITLGTSPLCEESVPNLAEILGEDLRILVSPERCTVYTSHSQTRKKKTAPHRAKRKNNRVYPPNCSVSLLSSLFKSLSFLRTVSIFSTECRTVV